MSGHVTRSVRDRLFARLVQNATGCLEWTGAHDRMGHGQMWADGRLQYTHRIAWQLVHGPIPPGLCVCHSCDNPPCANVEHLFLGSRRENNQDRDRKGRAYNGQASKTHCKRGHAFTPENTYEQLNGRGRGCRTCRSLVRAERKARMKATSAMRSHAKKS